MPPIVPCSSVNSRTMSVARSALASRPAGRGASAASAAPERVLRHPPREPLDALGLLPVASELLVEQDRVEPRDAALERHLAVRVPEEPRVAQPCREHALGVAADHLGLLRLHVGHGQKPRAQRPVPRPTPETSAGGESSSSSALLPAARGTRARSDPARPSDTPPGPAPRSSRPDCRDGRAVDAHAQSAGLELEVADDALAALVAIEHDEVLGEPRAIVVEGLHLDGAAGRGRSSSRNRCPWVMAPLRTSCTSGLSAAAERRMTYGTTRPPYRNRSHRIGRPNVQLALAVVEPRVPVHLLREAQAPQDAR